MILKFYETNKINLERDKFILFYGKNEGFKTESIKNLIKEKKEIFSYEEREILEDTNKFIESTLSKSLFESEKIIIIKRATDKIFKVIDEIIKKNIEELIIIINSENLEKKSKLRSLYEKDKKCICIAFYPDNEATLLKLAYSFLKDKKISMSTSNINFIVNKCNEDRGKLVNELEKIESFSKNQKKINSEDIAKLINLNQNHNVSELVNNCLAKNKNKIIHILNENNFSNEDCVVIARTFIAKSKKILALSYDYQNNKNIEQTISSAKPPIFWKDKEITKKQIYNWSPEKIKSLIYELSALELLVKKNINSSVNLTTNFILEQTTN